MAGDSPHDELGDFTATKRPQDARGETKASASDRTDCHVCGHVVAPYYRHCPQCEGRRNREKVDRLAAVIREVKSWVDHPADPETERDTIKQLYELDHPDVKGLLGWVESHREVRSVRPGRVRR